MPVRRILIGQVWKNPQSGDTYLVTKIYNEALASFAMLRKTGAETEALIRVKIMRTPEGQELPGYVYTQESDSF
jgi:hypothetical protein